MSEAKRTILQGWSLNSRYFVVTGGSNGIGLATVKVSGIVADRFVVVWYDAL